MDSLSCLEQACRKDVASLPETQPFISEIIDDQLQKRLDKMGIKTENAEKALKEINEFGQKPESVLPKLMLETRVLGLGEMHSFPNPQRELGSVVMKDLRDAGATHIAIEAGSDKQDMLNKFMEPGGKLDVGAMPTMLQDQPYINLLNAAKESGIKIIAVDRRDGHENDNDASKKQILQENGESRDQIMAGNIKKILEQDPSSKVVFWVGSFHLNRMEAKSEQKTAADILRDNTSVITVDPLYDLLRGESFHALPELTAGLKQSVAISTSQAADVGAMPYGTAADTSEPYDRDWDYIIAYPHEAAQQK